MLSKRDYDNIQTQRKQGECGENVAFLGNTQLFRDCSRVRLLSINEQATEVHLHPGTVIYKLAEPSEYLYLLKKGTVKIEAGFDMQELVKIPIVSQGS